jgi:hypothetical protein
MITVPPSTQEINYLLVNSSSSTSSMAQHCPFVSMLSGYLHLRLTGTAAG